MFTKRRLLHFLQDEKVVNDAIDNFEKVFPNENLFIVLSKIDKKKYVRNQKNTLFLYYKSSQLKFILHKSKDFEEVIFHSMDSMFYDIIHRINHPQMTWMVWGADLYESLLYRKGYKLYFNENVLFKVRSQRLPVPIYKLMVKVRDFFLYKSEIKALKKMNAVCAGPYDYKLLIKYYPSFNHCIHKRFFYYSLERLMDENTIDKYVSGYDIWVNNAAGYNGNHIEIFERLNKLNLNNISRIHTPLSYGVPKWAKYIESEGKRLLGEKFDPMLTFLPVTEYYSRFLSSNSFIFGHLRQCAHGNIIVAFYLGAKVFLFKGNPLYSYYKGEGVVIFNIEEDLSDKNLCTPLSEDERMHNRNIMIEKYSLESLLSIIKNNF